MSPLLFLGSPTSTTARAGMSYMITELRGMTEAGTAEYTIGSTAYWTDDQLQVILDSKRQDVVFQPLTSYPVQIGGGSISYQDYRSSYGYLEETTGGTAVMYLQDSTGATVGTANYTADYRRGQFQFSANQAGTAYYMTARSYDLNAAAGEVWRRKAAHYAPTSFDFSTDNHSISRSQVYQHCNEMSQYFTAMSGDGISTISMVRSDLA
jgi:hypothetical protein